MQRPILVMLATAIAAVQLPTAPVAAAVPARSDPSLAAFGDRRIDLRISWEGATACTSDGESTTCFTTEAAMDRFLQASKTPLHDVLDVDTGAVLDGRGGPGPEIVALATCSSALRLYTATSYTGSVLNLSSRLVALNLSAYGFNNVTSSYRIGGCAAELFDGSNASGAAYPGSTSAFAQSASMSAGWDDRVSSVYIT